MWFRLTAAHLGHLVEKIDIFFVCCILGTHSIQYLLVSVKAIKARDFNLKKITKTVNNENFSSAAALFKPARCRVGIDD